MDHFFIELILIPFVSIIASILLVTYIINRTTKNGIKSVHWLLLLVAPLLTFILITAYEAWKQLFYFQTDFSINSGFLILPAIVFAICAIPVIAKIYSKKK